MAAGDLMVAAGLSERLLSGGPGRRILVYHGVRPDSSPAINGRFIATSLLERHLAFFKESFHVVPLAGYIDGAAHATRFTIALTFDDGYACGLDGVLPLLERYGLSATFFVSAPAAVDDDVLWPDELDLASHLHTRPVTLRGETLHRDRRGVYRERRRGDTLKARCVLADASYVRDALAVLCQTPRATTATSRTRATRTSTHTTVGDLRVAPMAPERLPDLKKLLEAGFEHRFSLATLRAKYDTKHAGMDPVGFVAHAADGIAAGYYGVIPALCTYGGQPLTIGQSAGRRTPRGTPTERKYFLAKVRPEFRLGSPNTKETPRRRRASKVNRRRWPSTPRPCMRGWTTESWAPDTLPDWDILVSDLAGTVPPTDLDVRHSDLDTF